MMLALDDCLDTHDKLLVVLRCHDELGNRLEVFLADLCLWSPLLSSSLLFVPRLCNCGRCAEFLCSFNR